MALKSFQSGNSFGKRGRPVGSHKKYLAYLSLMDNGNDTFLFKKAYEKAMEGDTNMIKFLLSPLIPSNNINNDDELIIDSELEKKIKELIDKYKKDY